MTDPKHDPARLLDNHANQLNKNSDAFWRARGYPARPSDWATRDPNLPPPNGQGTNSPKK